MSELYTEINLKLIFLGHGGGGKTSLVNSIIGEPIPMDYLPTIGSTIEKKEYILDGKDISITANLWDLGGQRKFNPLNPSFFRNTDIAFLVIDVSEPEEYIMNIRTTYLEPLIQQIDECLIIIVGNKIDKEFNKKLLKEVLKQEKLEKFPIVFTSALEDNNIVNLIDFAIYSYLVEMSDELEEDNIPITYHDFLDSIDRNERELKNVPVNVADISSKVIRHRAPLKIKERKQDEEELRLEKLQFLRGLRERLEDLNGMKEQIRKAFQKNITNVESLITSLKNTPIETLTTRIDKTLEQIKFFKDDFELKLDSLLEIIEFENLESLEGSK
jgi:Ras-related protein Rab-6A